MLEDRPVTVTGSDTIDRTIMQANRCLSEALKLAAAGYRLTPVTITRGPNGKKAARFHGLRKGRDWVGWRHEDAWSSDPDQIKAWWTDHPSTSFAIGGAANAIEGVDLDVKDGVDAVAWWDAQGLPGSPFTQTTPTGGVHLIWRCGDGAGLPQEAGVTFGRGVDTRNRSGLFFAAGAYVAGEEGSYQLLADLPALADLPVTPPVVVSMFAEHGRAQREARPVDGRIVVHDESWQQTKVAEALQRIRDHDRDAGGYRDLLNGAGLLYGRAIEQGFLTVERAEAAILDAHRSVWGDEVWPENLHTIRTALADGPRLERWRVPAAPVAASTLSSPSASAPVRDTERQAEPISPTPVTVGDQNEDADAKWPGEVGWDPDQAAERAEAELLETAIRSERRRQTARRVVASEGREALRVLGGLAFLQAPTPEYLVPDMLLTNSTAKLFGPPGSTKSFLALDLAMCLVTGRPWRGTRLGRHRVHYVMAEGQAVNTVRALGWLHHFAPDLDHAELDGWLTVIPQGVLLTPEGVADYVRQVESDRPALVILDTKNRMMIGNENDAGDNAVMIRSMDAIRTASGGACVLLVDHTGVHDTSRGRGSNAVEGAMDTEVRVTSENGIATAEVTRNKIDGPGRQWCYRLSRVEHVPGLRPGMSDPAVCVPADRRAGDDPFNRAEDWQRIDLALPDDIAVFRGSGATAVPMLARFMRYSAADGIGFSLASAKAALRTHCLDVTGKPMWSNDTIERAWSSLVKLGRLQVAEGGGSVARSLWIARPEDPS